ncbi:MAG TPA: alpha-E domain-containing protein [Candidatus Dormibacteraeota bacterium]|nr:alpha-E domain-containing protein [Candidatus Dormibacteraeota bacterium]
MALLSRVATVLYVLGRDIERTEHLARLLRVHFELSLDRPAPAGRFWSDFLRLAGWTTEDAVTRDHAFNLVLRGERESLRVAMESARRAAQAVRPSLSMEVWEQVNVLYLRLSDDSFADGPSDALRRVEMGTQLIAGLVDDTMAHDEAWRFVKLGKHLSRAANVARLVAHKWEELAGQGDDAIAWAGVLRCCASLEAFRLRHEASTSAEAVSRFLLLDRLSPRSAGFCIGEALSAVRAIDGPGRESPPHRALGRLAATFQYADPERVGTAPGELIARFDEQFGDLQRALRVTYFQPSRLSLQLADEPLSRHPQQQQQ